MKIKQHLFEWFKQNYLMLIPMTIIFQSCLGSVAAFYILSLNTKLPQMLALGVSVCCCMGYNASVLAQRKLTYVYTMLWISILANTILILIYAWN